MSKAWQVTWLEKYVRCIHLENWGFLKEERMIWRIFNFVLPLLLHSEVYCYLTWLSHYFLLLHTQKYCTMKPLKKMGKKKKKGSWYIIVFPTACEHALLDQCSVVYSEIKHGNISWFHFCRIEQMDFSKLCIWQSSFALSFFY